jgi:2-hydroxychromene-2-carboxylate isomerase
MPRFAFHRAPRRPRRRDVVQAAAADLFTMATEPTARRTATSASREAAAAAYLRAHDNALRALQLVADGPAMTSNECARRLGLDDQAIRPRFTQMKARGWLQALRETRATGHGGRAHVHQITPAGRAMLLLLTAPNQEDAA